MVGVGGCEVCEDGVGGKDGKNVRFGRGALTLIALIDEWVLGTRMSQRQIVPSLEHVARFVLLPGMNVTCLTLLVCSASVWSTACVFMSVTQAV